MAKLEYGRNTACNAHVLVPGVGVSLRFAVHLALTHDCAQSSRPTLLSSARTKKLE